MDFNLKTLPLERSVFNKSVVVANRQEIQKHLFEFVKEHSFPQELVDFYHQEANPELPLERS